MTIPPYPEWIDEGGDFYTLIGGTKVRVSLREESKTSWVYVIAVEVPSSDWKELVREQVKVTAQTLTDVMSRWKTLDKEVLELLVEARL